MNTRLDSAPTRTAEAVYQNLVRLGAKDPDGRPGFLRDFVTEAYRLGPLVGINPDWIITQAAVETGDPNRGLPPFVSAIYRSRGNTAGIGVTDGPDHGYGWRDGATAARVQIAHMYVYVHGNRDLDPDIAEYVDLDPRWDAVVAKGWQGTVATVDDLSGKWATASNYGAMLRSRWKDIIDAADATQPPSGGDTGGPDMAEQKAFVIAMGHRNTDRGGASNEINWTPKCARAIRDAIVARGGKAVIVQEDDGDNDPNWFPGGLQAMARRAVDLASKHGPFEAYISCHYNGGAGPGFHAIFPDAWSGVDQKVNNPLDVKLCENIVAAVRKTNTVSILSWTSHGPGVMSERESGVGAQGYRLGEFYGSIGFRDRTARVIIEAGSIDVARERNYINDDNWLRNVYAEAIVNGLEATFGALGAAEQPKPDEPKPEVPKPVEYVKAVPIPALDKFLSGDVPAMPFSIPFEFEGTQWIGLPVNDTVRVKAEKGTPRYQTPGGEGRLNPDVSHNTEFELAFRMVKVGDSEAKWGRTRWGTWIDLADVEYVSD